MLMNLEEGRVIFTLSLTNVLALLVLARNMVNSINKGMDRKVADLATTVNAELKKKSDFSHQGICRVLLRSLKESFKRTEEMWKERLEKGDEKFDEICKELQGIREGVNKNGVEKVAQRLAAEIVEQLKKAEKQ